MYLSGTHSQTNFDYQPGSNQNNMYSNPNNGGLKVKFKYNSTEFLNEDEKKNFEDYLENSVYDGAVVTITGYSSSDGSEETNLTLSERRANKIAGLVRAKYPNITINSNGAGEQEGDLEENRAVQINAGPGYTWSDPTPSPSPVGPVTTSDDYKTRVTDTPDFWEQFLYQLGAPDNQDVVIFMSGLNPLGSDHQNEPFTAEDFENQAPDIIGFVRELQEANDLTVASEAFLSGWDDNIMIGNVTNFIAENLGRNGRLIIVGYSWGGDTALELADLLPDNLCDLMVTIDASDGWTYGDEMDYDIPVGGGATRVINFWQPIKQGAIIGTGSGRRVLPQREDGSVENVRLDNVTIQDGEETRVETANHSNIDNSVEVWERLTEEVSNVLLNN